MTHEELCERAARWLRNTKRCRLILREVVSYAGEIPDAIGWQAGCGVSLLIECKTSRSDFSRDTKKWARNTIHSMGQRRYYMTPPGLLTLDDVPDDWGLLEVHGRSVRVLRDAKVPRELDSCGYRAELMHMLRGIRMANGEDERPTKKSEAYVRNLVAFAKHPSGGSVCEAAPLRSDPAGHLFDPEWDSHRVSGWSPLDTNPCIYGGEGK